MARGRQHRARKPSTSKRTVQWEAQVEAPHGQPRQPSTPHSGTRPQGRRGRRRDPSRKQHNEEIQRAQAIETATKEGSSTERSPRAKCIKPRAEPTPAHQRTRVKRSSRRRRPQREAHPRRKAYVKRHGPRQQSAPYRDTRPQGRRVVEEIQAASSVMKRSNEPRHS